MNAAGNDARHALARDLRALAPIRGAMGSPFYAVLERLLADDIDAGGPTWDLLEPHAAAPLDDAYSLRLLGGIHRMVLAGEAPSLERHYPSTGGDGDAEAAWPAVRSLLARRPRPVLAALAKPPQTNEVGRSVALVGAFLVVSAETGVPLRLLEIGASAGLNLRADRYRYEQDGQAWGDPASPVRFAEPWVGGRPPLEAGAVVACRRGCDREPADATTADGRLSVLSYLWPGQEERFAITRAALDVAGTMPVRIDREDAVTWLPARLAKPAEGQATVVFHSVVWQYLSGPTRRAVVGALEEAGARASAHAPLAWARLEPNAQHYFPAELRLTMWPGGRERLLATAGFHLGSVTWTG